MGSGEPRRSAIPSLATISAPGVPCQLDAVDTARGRWIRLCAVLLMTLASGVACGPDRPADRLLIDQAFFVELRSNANEWVLTSSPGSIRDLPLAPKSSARLAWMGTKDVRDDEGNVKIARVAAYRLVGPPPNPETETGMSYERGDLLFCADLTYDELKSRSWRIDLVPGEMRCASPS